MVDIDSFVDFTKDRKTYSATIREYIIIGEAIVLLIEKAPLSSERFNAGVVAAMQKKKILGVTSRYVMIVK